MNLKSTIESLLFVSPKSLKLKQICKFLEKEEAEVKAALDELAQERKNTGVILLENNGEYQMATNPENSPYVKTFLNSELREKLTDATVEVLAIIAYKQPVSKAEIEAIRGVNSQYSLRHLLMRGIIEKTPNPHDARGFLYQTTTEFLQHLGLASLKDLPEFEKLVGQIKLPETPAAAENPASENPEPQNTVPETLQNPREAKEPALETGEPGNSETVSTQTGESLQTTETEETQSAEAEEEDDEEK